LNLHCDRNEVELTEKFVEKVGNPVEENNHHTAEKAVVEDILLVVEGNHSAVGDNHSLVEDNHSAVGDNHSVVVDNHSVELDSRLHKVVVVVDIHLCYILVLENSFVFVRKKGKLTIFSAVI
jgi:hypothetical protein